MARRRAVALLGVLLCAARLRCADCQALAAATRVLVVGIDSHGEARIETFISDSTSGAEATRFLAAAIGSLEQSHGQ